MDNKIPTEINEVLTPNTNIDNTLEVTNNVATNTTENTSSILEDVIKNNATKENLIAKLNANKVNDTTTDTANETDKIVSPVSSEVKFNDVTADLKIENANTTDTIKTAFDISDIPMEEDASVSSVLGNLDDEPAVAIDNNTIEGSLINEVEFNFNNEEIDFSKEDSVEPTMEEALSEETVEQSKNEEKYIYHSYSDQKISVRGDNPKLSFMDKISVDLNDITITKKSPIQQVEDINMVFNNNVATFTVICCQSGYTADMSGLTLAEKNAINNSDGGDLFQFRQRLYKTVYNKIQSMSIPKPEFNNWLKITSFNDLSTLLFGIYCQTFIDNNDFDITCGKCGKNTSVTVNNQSLVEVRDRATFEKRDEIISSIKTGEELVAASIVHKDERVMLNDSKIVVDVATPSLHDHLSLLKASNQNTLQEYADTFSAMLFISHLYMLDLKETYNTGRAVYYEVTDKARLLNILLKLSNKDGEQLENAIQEKLGKYQINYEIHNVTCSHCNTKLPGIPVDIETILFTRINRTNGEK